MSITAVNAGRLSDKYHPQKIASIGMFIAIFAFVILSFLNANTPLYVVVIAMVLQALGMGLFSSPNMNAIMSCVSKEDVVHASGSQITMRAIGQTMSMAILTLVFSWIMGGLAISPQYGDMIVQASQIICLISALACILAVIVSVIGIKSENRYVEN